MTATTHCGVHRYTFPERKESRILMDLLFPTEWDYGFSLTDARIRRVSNTEIEGYAQYQSGPWSDWNEYTLHFVVRFSKPFQQLNGWNAEEIREDIQEISGSGDIGAYAIYETQANEPITVCTGLSLVSIKQARLNMEEELAPLDFDFDKTAQQARAQWNELLGRITVKGGTEQDKVKFYTNLYRAFAGKQTWSDVNGKYVDAEENVQTLEKGKMYGGDAFWNTY